MNTPIVILPTAWAVTPILDVPVSILKGCSYDVSIAKYPGRFGDKTPLDGITLDDYESCAFKHIMEMNLSGQKVILIGFSMGGAIACRLAQKYPHLIEGVISYGTPMISIIPVWKTVWRILSNSKYRSHIFSGKGSFALERREIEDFLYSGFSRGFETDLLVQQPESSAAVREMMLQKLKPDRDSNVPHVFITCSGEVFHRNAATERFAAKQGSRAGMTAEYVEVEGGHFDALCKRSLLEQLRIAVSSVHNRAWEYKQKHPERLTPD